MTYGVVIVNKFNKYEEVINLIINGITLDG